MIVAFVGERGSGKTLSMIGQSYIDSKTVGRKVYANMKGLTFPYTFLEKKDLISYSSENTELKNCVLLLDELHIFTDSRRAMSKTNLILSYFVLQSRKHDVDIYYTTQEFGQVDKRLRQQTDVIVSCESRKVTNNEGEEIVIIFQEWLTKKQSAKNIIIGNNVFKLYNTNEVIEFDKT